MKILFQLFIVMICTFMAYPAWAVQTISGDINGTFTGSATDGSGAYTGNIEVNWTAAGVFDTTGNFVETVTGSGTFGGNGITGLWTHPVVSGTLDGSGGGPLVWYIDTSTAPIQATGNFSGATTFTVPLPAPMSPMQVPLSTTGTCNATLPINP